MAVGYCIVSKIVLSFCSLIAQFGGLPQVAVCENTSVFLKFISKCIKITMLNF